MAKDHFCITTGCSVVSEVCEICGSHSGKEEYKCLLNVTQSSLILTNASQEPAVSTRWMETADSSIMPVIPEVWCYVPEDSHLQGTYCLHILKI